MIHEVLWLDVCDELRRAGTFGDDERYIKQQVDEGVARCWRVGGVALITRADCDELTILCLAGEQLGEVAEEIKAAAHAAGFNHLRFHTQRQALGRLLKPVGAEFYEYVFRIDLNVA